MPPGRRGGLLACILAVAALAACPTARGEDKAEAACAPFPVILSVHGAYRQNTGSDTTLFLLSAASALQALFAQFSPRPCGEVQLSLWLEVSSFEGHLAQLSLAVQNLERTAERLRRAYQVSVRVRFSTGIVETYSRSLRFCQAAPWCRYTFSLEDDFYVDAPAVRHSAQQLVDLLDGEPRIGYLRLSSAHWDAPCVTEDLSHAVPIRWTGGWTNPAHFARAEHATALLALVRDHGSRHNFGLECHSDYGRLSLHNLCHHVTYTCHAAEPYVRHPQVCDTAGFQRCDQHTSQFVQVNSTTCLDAAGRRPQYQHCGLAVYGPWGHNAAQHMNGSKFSIDRFWEGGPPGEDLAASLQRLRPIDSFSD